MPHSSCCATILQEGNNVITFRTRIDNLIFEKSTNDFPGVSKFLPFNMNIWKLAYSLECGNFDECLYVKCSICF